MNKILKAFEIRNIGVNIFGKWETLKSEIKINPRSLYNLISLKKKLEAQNAAIQETLQGFVESAGATLKEDGSYAIPEDKVQEVNVQLDDFARTNMSIDYEPIILKETDFLPTEIMEALFEFIEVRD